MPRVRTRATKTTLLQYFAVFGIFFLAVALLKLRTSSRGGQSHGDTVDEVPASPQNSMPASLRETPSPSVTPPSTFIAATEWRKPADWFRRRLGPSLINVLGVLNAQSEHAWRVQIFLWPTREAQLALDASPIVQQLEAKGSVIVTRVPDSHARLSESALRLTAFYWESIATAGPSASHTLIFDANSAFCSTAGRGVDEFFDYKLTFPHGKPGLPYLVSLDATHRAVADAISRRSGSELVASRGSFSSFLLREFGEKEGGKSIAPEPVQRSFGLLETTPENELEMHPFAITALMRTLSRDVRTDVLHNCPEAKQMFPVFHDKDCIYQLVTSGPAMLCADKHEGRQVMVRRRDSNDLSSTLLKL